MFSYFELSAQQCVFILWFYSLTVILNKTINFAFISSKKVIKSGTVLEKIVLNKEFVSLGRLGDILCEHPSLSRFHAILQYSNGQIDTKYPQGFYMYDLNSTHGTIINKSKINPNQYVPINNESMFKLGLSTRIYILHGEIFI